MTTQLDQKTRDLLLKVRKKAWSSFGTAQWQAALTAMGFRFTVVEKERNTVLAVEIVAPDGKSMTARKDPKSLRIMYWDFLDWMKAQETSLSDLASKALGMRTVEEERGYQEYKARDWTHTGTCGICEKNVKMEANGERQVLVLHGYERPGWGCTVGRCYGVGLPPHEISPEAATRYLAGLREELPRLQIFAAALRAGSVTSLTVISPISGQTKTIQVGGQQWAETLANKLNEIAGEEERTKRSITHFEQKVAGWKPDDLPEIKMQKRFGSKA